MQHLQSIMVPLFNFGEHKRRNLNVVPRAGYSGINRGMVNSREAIPWGRRRRFFVLKRCRRVFHGVVIKTTKKMRRHVQLDLLLLFILITIPPLCFLIKRTILFPLLLCSFNPILPSHTCTTYLPPLNNIMWPTGQSIWGLHYIPDHVMKWGTHQTADYNHRYRYFST